MQHVSIEQGHRDTIRLAERTRPFGDQLEHRLCIAGGGRHDLQHVDCRCLLFDPFAVFAVALRPAPQCVPAIRDMSRHCVMAITACSANVCSSAIWVSLNPAPPEGFPFRPMTPTGSPRRNSGTATIDWPPSVRASGEVDTAASAPIAGICTVRRSNTARSNECVLLRSRGRGKYRRNVDITSGSKTVHGAYAEHCSVELEQSNPRIRTTRRRAGRPGRTRVVDRPGRLTSPGARL